MSGAWGDWWDLVTLTHVCQHWRNVALGTPQLWADAAQSVLAEPRDRGFCYLCLPTFLARSGSCPLRLDLPGLGTLTDDIEDLDGDAVVKPHISRVVHLSAQLLNITQVVQFVTVHSLHMPNLESFHIPQVKRTFLGVLLAIDTNTLRFWRDTDFPHLHTLTISAYCFVRHVAVPSLKELVLHDEPRNYDEFLAGLERCAHGLESLTLRGWSHPEWSSRFGTESSATRSIDLPSLRRFRVSLASRSTNTDPLAFLFESLLFPADVSLHLDWKCNPGNAHQLLPKHLMLTGLHAPPFFDGLCLHLFAAPYTTSMHCYVGNAQRLCVCERPFHPRFPDGRGLSDFLDEHRHPAVTRLAVDFEMDLDSRKGFTGRMASQVEAFRAFVHGLPNLRRLDLLGNGIGDVKLQFAKAFLDLPLPIQDSSLALTPGETAAGKRTLDYVCGEYGDDGLPVDPDVELAHLEQLLKVHRASGGRSRLHRLEICIADPSRETHVTSRPVYPYVHDVPASEEAVRSLALRYKLRFEALVDEVVFVGQGERLGRGMGYRMLPGKAAVSQPPLSGSRRSKSKGRGRRLGVH